jgi:hypothetical protein
VKRTALTFSSRVRIRCSWLLSAATFVAGIVATDAHAQCPLYAPQLDTRGGAQPLLITGLKDGCSNAGHDPNDSTVCSAVGGETIAFDLVSLPGRPVQSCDTVAWDFGDGTSATVFGSSRAEHAYAVQSWIDNRFTATATVTNALGSQSAKATFEFSLGACTFGKSYDASSLKTAFAGARSGCTAHGGKCAVAEPIAFSAYMFPAAAEHCDYWRVSWNDGTIDESLPISESSASVQVQHEFPAPGNFSVRFTLMSGGNPNPTAAAVAEPPAVTMNVTVTQTGEAPPPPPPRRRSARP